MVYLHQDMRVDLLKQDCSVFTFLVSWTEQKKNILLTHLIWGGRYRFFSHVYTYFYTHAFSPVFFTWITGFVGWHWY